ncbi:MAG: TolB family protein, partial [Candidatus Promineifilaceae bacterium]
MNATTAAQARPQRARVTGYPADSLRFDWAFSLLGFLLVSGLLVDGWAHFHGQVDESFFTPWHLLFYSAFGFVALFLGLHQFRNMRPGHHFNKALPQGYWLSLMGATVFALGGVGDMIWHTLFGIESGSEALTSPTHLVLAIGMGLIVTGPLRAAWNRATPSKRWLALGPSILGASLLLVLLAFFTGYAHPFIDPGATQSSGAGEVQQPIEELYVMNLDGTGQTRLTNEPHQGAFTADWSPDGTQMVFSRVAGPNDQADLYLMYADGSDPVQLTDLPGGEFEPAWSPDGTTIAFVYMGDESPDVYTIQVDGSDLVQVTDAPTGEFGPAWSTDGTKLMYSQHRGEEDDSIIVANADGSDPTVFADGFSSAWSPDGTQIAYAAGVDDNVDVYVADVDGGNVKRITTHPEFDVSPSWTADGKQIVFESWRGGHGEVYIVPVSGESDATPAVNLTQNPSLNSTASEVSPDGRRILYSAAGSISPDESHTQDAGVAAILLQAVFIAGVVVLLARHWALPFGAITLVLTLSTFAMVILSDMFMLVPAAVVTGLIADVLVWRLKPSENGRALSLIAFFVPALLLALYMLTLQIAVGIGWSIHVWTGAIFLAGLMGLLLNALTAAANSPSQIPQVAG